jgi:hypothetical protein
MNNLMRVRKWKLKAKKILSGESKPLEKKPKFIAITKNSIIYKKYFSSFFKK